MLTSPQVQVILFTSILLHFKTEIQYVQIGAEKQYYSSVLPFVGQRHKLYLLFMP